MRTLRRTMKGAASTLLAFALFCSASPVHANGVVSHMHISDLAVARLPPGELRDLLSDPELLEIYRAGSVFPDSGYAAEDDYGEIAHWEPFTESYVRWIRARHPPPFDDAEARRHVAFLLGQASHGLADQIFDSLFMARTRQLDGDASDLDAAAETWLIIEHDPDNRIPGFIPADDMVALFGDSSLLDHTPTVETFDLGRTRIVQAINGLYSISWTLYEGYWVQLPWSATHYYEADAVPGSLPHIATFVAAYWQMLWERLHGRDALETSSLGTWPEDGAVNFEVDPDRIESRAMVVFGHGIAASSLTSDNVRLLQGGVPVTSTARFIYGSSFANAVLVQPDEALAFDTDTVIEIDGLQTFDAIPVPGTVSFSFRTRCAPDRVDDCPPLPEPWVRPEDPMPPVMPRPPRRDGGPGVDAAADAGFDVGVDAGDARVGGGGCDVGGGAAGAWLFFSLVAWRRRRPLSQS